MPNPIVGLIGASVGSSVIGAKASGKAADAQSASAAASVAEQRRQFDKVQQLLAPWVANGRAAGSAAVEFLGLRGPEAEAAQVEAIRQGGQYQTMLAEGENALLQNASATGGLRGGNTQAALQEYAPQLLNQLIQQRYGNLVGLSSMGQNAAAMTGSAAQSAANQISQAYTQAGNAQAQGALGQAQAWQSGINSLSGIMGAYQANPAAMTGSLF